MDTKSKEIIKSLTKISKNSNLTINELRIIIAIEKIIARIKAHNILKDKLIFKGGFVLLKTIESSALHGT